MNLFNRFNGTSFVVIGFPKCGTTALMAALAQQERVHVGKLIANNYEADLSQVDRPPDYFLKHGFLNGHKFVNYIYNEAIINEISMAQSAPIVIICVRKQRTALISWHAMHRRHAKLGIGAPMHSPEARTFFLNCDIQSYWNRFAKHKMNYLDRIRGVLKYLSTDRVLIIRQELMSADMNYAVTKIGQHLGFVPKAVALETMPAKVPYTGPALPERLDARLEREEREFLEFLDAHFS